MSNFKDSQNIIIENGVPKYSYKGLSYRDKLKNGISLDHAFELENYCSTFEISVSVNQRVTFADCLITNIVLDSSELETEEPDITFPKKRKGKWSSLKKAVASNFKKNRRKQLGHSDKLFNLQQNTNFEFDSESIDDEYDYYDDDSSYQGNNYRTVHTDCEGFWYERGYHLDTLY